MAINKTVETEAIVTDFINLAASGEKRDDCLSLMNLFEETTGFKARMWGPAIIGFGSYHYQYESGREGDAPLAAFSPRKDAIVVYISTAFESREHLLSKLGKHQTGKVCVYIKKLEDIDPEVLKDLIRASVAEVQAQYPG